jgi:hypothetical protein
MTCVTSGTAERTSARLAHEIWQKDINGRGGLLGRPIELVCYDDGGDASLVSGVRRPTPKIPCCTKNVYAKQRPE